MPHINNKKSCCISSNSNVHRVFKSITHSTKKKDFPNCTQNINLPFPFNYLCKVSCSRNFSFQNIFFLYFTLEIFSLLSFNFSTLTVTLINAKKRNYDLNSLLETPSLNENSKRDENVTFRSFHN